MRCEWVEGMHNCGAAMWRRLEVSASPARLAARPNPAILTPVHYTDVQCAVGRSEALISASVMCCQLSGLPTGLHNVLLPAAPEWPTPTQPTAPLHPLIH